MSASTGHLAAWVLWVQSLGSPPTLSLSSFAQFRYLASRRSRSLSFAHLRFPSSIVFSIEQTPIAFGRGEGRRVLMARLCDTIPGAAIQPSERAGHIKV